MTQGSSSRRLSRCWSCYDAWFLSPPVSVSKDWRDGVGEEGHPRETLRGATLGLDVHDANDRAAMWPHPTIPPSEEEQRQRLEPLTLQCARLAEEVEARRVEHRTDGTCRRSLPSHRTTHPRQHVVARDE